MISVVAWTMISLDERIAHVLGGDAAEDAVAQRLDDVAALDERRSPSMYFTVPQSYSDTITSWDTSTSRRVR